MDILSIYELYIETEKLTSSFELLLDSEVITYEYMTESALDMPKRIIASIKKMINIFITYMDDFQGLFKIHNREKELNTIIKKCEKSLKYTPKVLEREIIFRSYGRLDDLSKVKSADDMYKASMNFGNKILLQGDKRLCDLMDKYHMYKAGNDKFFKIKIKNALPLMKAAKDVLHKMKQEYIKTLTDLSSHIERSENINFSLLKWFTGKLKKVQRNFTKNVTNITMNIEATLYEIKHGTELEVSETAKKLRKKPTTEEQMKTAVKLKDIEFFGETFEIYQLKESNISCFNHRGHKIYMDNAIFSMPKAYQAAILYHEIGHYMKGHFGPKNGIENEAKQAKRFQKEMKKYDRMVDASNYTNSKRLMDDSELVYILVELEADRFSAGIVGKTNVKQALTKRFDRDLKNAGVSKEVYDYNMFRMKLRTKMI